MTGGNCERSAYFIAEALGHQTPPDGLRLAEFLADSSVAMPVEIDQAQTGDIIFFKRPDRPENRGFHVGVVWKNGTLHVVHNARGIGYLTVETLEETMAHPHHSQLAGIRRLPHNPNQRHVDRLIRMGLTFLLT